MQKLAIVTPSVLPAMTGNAIDADRWKRGMERKGKKVRLFLSSDRAIAAKLKRFNPDIAHVLDAYKGGRAIKALKAEKVPIVLSLAGPDVNIDHEDKRRRQTVVESLHAADQIIVFYNKLKVKLMMWYPRSRERMNVINKEVELPKSGFDFRKRYKLTKDNFVFYMPGEISKIKNNEFPIKSLHKLFDLYPQVRFIISGPIVDKVIANKIKAYQRKYSFIRYIGVVPRKNMYAAYRDSDVVLNCSESEGMPTSILESMMLGKAVLAHKIEATEAIIQHNHNGLLYKNETKFYQLAERLIVSKRLKGRLEKNSYDTYRFFYSNKQEVQRILQVYEKAREMALIPD